MREYAVISSSLVDDFALKRLSRRAGSEAPWHLICLILWATNAHPDGDLSGVPVAEIEEAAGWEPADGSFHVALQQTEFLVGTQMRMDFWKPDKPTPLGRIASKAWAKIRRWIFDRDDWTCVYCGAKDGPLECDHVVPLSRGGGNQHSNLATACAPCNRSKRNLLLSEWGGRCGR